MLFMSLMRLEPVTCLHVAVLPSVGLGGALLDHLGAGGSIRALSC